jgi:hypothetical protein
VGVLPTLCKSSSSPKLLQTQHSKIWWMDTCPWHGLNTILRLHSSTMLGACLLQPHRAIYSQSQALGSWRSDDTIPTWSRGPADKCVIKGDEYTPSRDVFVASASMMPEPTTASHGYSTPLDSWVVCRFMGGKRVSNHCRPVTL